MLAVVVVAAVVFVASCSKDSDSGKIIFDSEAAYIPSAGASKTVGFTTRNVKLSTLKVASYPTAWPEPVLDINGMTLTITAPADLTDIEESGSVMVAGYTPEGTYVSSTIFAGVVTTVDMTANPANCYLVSEKGTNYEFSTKRADGSPIEVDHVAVLWETSANMIRYLELAGDKVSFYTGANTDGDAISEGNALIGAYDSGNVLLWSWHVWASDYDINADAITYANGYTVMSRNLGALDNDNSTTDRILASYGLYYQWGRKDPFAGPGTYNAANGTSAAMYDAKGSRVYMKTLASSAKTGNEEYARKNPMTYITGVEESDYDWLYSSHSTTLWADTKTKDDPCPSGWRVAPAAAFSGLSIVEDLMADYTVYENKFGWTLTDGTAESLYIAGGRRRYDNGTILNVYNPLPAALSVRNEAMDAQPWEGLFWTTGTVAGGQSAAFYFWFDKSDVAASGLQNNVAYWRANGLQVRCVKQ